MNPLLKKLTPVVLVERIEPILPFWVDRLGFTKQAEVPHGDALGFVILERDGVEVMYQTIESAKADSGLALPPSSVCLFIEVPDLDAVIAALKGTDVVVPRRRSSYGADEIFVREPAGNIVGFAAFPG